jgi:hypothetical protein
MAVAFRIGFQHRNIFGERQTPTAERNPFSEDGSVLGLERIDQDDKEQTSAHDGFQHEVEERATRLRLGSRQHIPVGMNRAV